MDFYLIHIQRKHTGITRPGGHAEILFKGLWLGYKEISQSLPYLCSKLLKKIYLGQMIQYKPNMDGKYTWQWSIFIFENA